MLTIMKQRREYREDSRAFCSISSFKALTIIAFEFLQTISKGSMLPFAATVQSRGGYIGSTVPDLTFALLKMLVFHQLTFLAPYAKGLISNNSFSSLSILDQFWQLKGRLNRKKTCLKHLISVISYFLLCEGQEKQY